MSFQQKEISGFLTILWQNDPFKAKWSILAKSYSLIRDSQGKANAPLEKFLAINGPLIGIIEPAYYLEALSWEVAVDEDGQTVMRRHGNSIDQHLLITNVSVNDVIRNSYNQGYFTGDLSKILMAKNEAAMAMAASVQPTSNKKRSTIRQLENHNTEFATGVNDQGSSTEQEQVPSTVVIEDDESGTGMTTHVEKAGNVESIGEDDSDVFADSNTVAIKDVQPKTSAFMTATMTSTVVQTHDLGSSSSLKTDADKTKVESQYKASTNNPDVSSLSASAFSLQGEYPFNTDFDPEFSGATFDPFMGNQFNVFDMSDAPWEHFINFDASA